MKGQINQKKLARVLKSIRLARGLTQEDLADVLFCDVRQIRRYESDGTDKLSIVSLYAEVFNLDLISILSEAQDAF